MLKPSSIILVFFLASNLISCSLNSLSSESPEGENVKISSLKLYLSQSSLNTTDFEQYYLKDKTFFSECGEIVRGRHKARQKNILKLNDAQIDNLKSLSAAVSELNKEQISSLAKPGQNKTLFDTGRLELNLKTTDSEQNLKTSMNEISTASSTAAKLIALLSRTVRGFSASKLCGNPSFYGLDHE